MTDSPRIFDDSVPGFDSMPVFDRDGFMERIDRDLELAGELMEIFFGDYPSQVESLERAVQAAKATEVVEIAHALKSVLGNIGAARCHLLCAQIEREAKGGDLSGCAHRVATLREEVERFKEESGAELAKLSSGG